MEKLLKQVFLLAGLISLAFGAYAYLAERPTTVIGELRAEMKHEADAIRAEKTADISQMRAEVTSKVDTASNTIIQRLQQIEQKLEKMDDRLYEMQRRQIESADIVRDVYSGG
jgi:TolA-binding protein